MRQQARVTVTMRELDRLKCIGALIQGDLRPMWAAERLGLTTRQGCAGWPADIGVKDRLG